MSSNPANHPLEDQFLLWPKRWRQDKRSRPGRWLSCANTRTDCGRIMSTYEPGWRPARPRNHKDLPVHFLHLVPTKARRPLYSMTLTYRWMTSYLLTALRSHGVHIPKRRESPIQKKAPSSTQPIHQYRATPGTERSQQGPMPVRASS